MTCKSCPTRIRCFLGLKHCPPRVGGNSSATYCSTDVGDPTRYHSRALDRRPMPPAPPPVPRTEVVRETVVHTRTDDNIVSDVATVLLLDNLLHQPCANPSVYVEPSQPWPRSSDCDTPAPAPASSYHYEPPASSPSSYEPPSYDSSSYSSSDSSSYSSSDW